MLRERNHRVKTSLQIIQSYLSLTRRLDRATADQSGVEAMEVRIQVLSIAYRKAFSEGRMRDVRIRQFAAEIVDNLSQTFSRPGLEVELKPDVHAALMIDRAIPLGLALVESAWRGSRPKVRISCRCGSATWTTCELNCACRPTASWPPTGQSKADGGSGFAARCDPREPGCGDDHSLAVPGGAAARPKCE